MEKTTVQINKDEKVTRKSFDSSKLFSQVYNHRFLFRNFVENLKS